MPQTTAEIIADVDETIARLEAYRLELEARPVAHGYLEPGPSDDDERGSAFVSPRVQRSPATPQGHWQAARCFQLPGHNF